MVTGLGPDHPTQQGDRERETLGCSTRASPVEPLFVENDSSSYLEDAHPN